MLFNSFSFLFFFLPISLFVYKITTNFQNKDIKIIWLVSCSLFFYGWWNFYYLILLIFSIFFNFFISDFLNKKNKLIFLWIGIIVNLTILCYFKYLNFFIENINYLIDTNYLIKNLILPLGISFFTFQQIMYLVDIYNQKSKKGSVLYYFSFVIFFPQLIAGPIVNYKNVIHQFHFSKYLNFNNSMMVGITIFIIGLFKKVCIADNIGIYSDHLFEFAKYSSDLTFFESWAAAIIFTFQLYFDFSGYSDMAIGLGILFGISLPLNFNSPFKSKNISIFWRNWHMTLSSFIRVYIFTPLTLFFSRIAITTNLKSINLFFLSTISPIVISYFLIGVWHGAGWNFILFGLIHGLFLLINIIWVNLLNFFLIYEKFKKNKFYNFVSHSLTFLCVVFAFVLFRAENIETAVNIYQSMLGMNQFGLPYNFLTDLQPWLSQFNFNFDGLQKNHFIKSKIIITIILALMILVMFLPNTIQLMRNYINHEEHLDTIEKNTKIIWKPNILWGMIIGMMFFLSLLNLTSPNEFLYFDF